MNRLFLLSLMMLTIGCGALKKKKSKADKSPKTTVSEQLKTLKKTSIDEEESYYSEYIPVNRSKMPYAERVESYVHEFNGIAMVEMVKYGIPASITLAQGILESGAGMGTLAQKSNNHFGIKCHEGWEGGSIKYDDDEKQECFRTYKHPNKSYEDHSIFLKNRSRYEKLFSFKMDDYKAWAKGLKLAGYATDPKYDDKLVRLIETYNLDEYDSMVLNKKKKNDREKKPSLNTKREDTKPGPVENTQKSKNTYVVKKGDTLYSLSKKYNVPIEQIRKRNNLDGNNISIGQELVID